MSSPEDSDLSDTDSEIESIPSGHHFHDFYNLSTYEMADADDREKFIIVAVVQNEVDCLEELLRENGGKDSDYMGIASYNGNNLLQIAIIHRNMEMFDYLLSLERFPLEHMNCDGKTALILALNGIGEFCDHASYQLMSKGASSQNLHLEHGESLLHYVVERCFVKVAKLLMERGYSVTDLNDSGYSALWSCLDAGLPEREETELVSALLTYGADLTIDTMYGYNMFEYAVKFSSADVIEQLFYHFYDQFTFVDVHFEVLLTLAEDKSPFFDETLAHTKKVILGFSSHCYYYHLFTIKVDYLKKLIVKCGDVIRQVLLQVKQDDYRICDRLCFKNVTALLDSELNCDVIYFIVNLSNKFCFNFLIGHGSEEAVVLESVCFLLSYGLRVTESNLQLFYKKYGYTELLKILLHMDIKVNVFKRSIRDVMLLFLYDVSLDLDKYLRDPQKYSLQNVHELLNHFAHPKLRELCERVANDEYFDNVIHQPVVPLLVELARNTFRRFFVRTFNIKNAKEFYSLLNGLPISVVHKRIITFETKLYH